MLGVFATAYVQSSLSGTGIAGRPAPMQNDVEKQSAPLPSTSSGENFFRTSAGAEMFASTHLPPLQVLSSPSQSVS